MAHIFQDALWPYYVPELTNFLPQTRVEKNIDEMFRTTISFIKCAHEKIRVFRVHGGKILKNLKFNHSMRTN